MEPLALRRARQRGTALFVALIMLVAMSVAAISLVRTVDSTVVVTGNLAFQQAALQIADFGIENAATALPAISGSSADTTWRLAGNCSVPGGNRNGWNYYPVMQNTGSPVIQGSTVSMAGVPNINWNEVPCVVNARIPEGYFVQFVMDRLCTGTLPILNLASNCVSESPQEGGSKKAGAPRFTGALAIHYRITVRVFGPSNAQSFVQVTLRD